MSLSSSVPIHYFGKLFGAFFLGKHLLRVHNKDSRTISKDIAPSVFIVDVEKAQGIMLNLSFIVTLSKCF